MVEAQGYTPHLRSIREEGTAAAWPEVDKKPRRFCGGAHLQWVAARARDSDWLAEEASELPGLTEVSVRSVVVASGRETRLTPFEIDSNRDIR